MFLTNTWMEMKSFLNDMTRKGLTNMGSLALTSQPGWNQIKTHNGTPTAKPDQLGQKHVAASRSEN